MVHSGDGHSAKYYSGRILGFWEFFAVRQIPNTKLKEETSSLAQRLETAGDIIALLIITNHSLCNLLMVVSIFSLSNDNNY